MGNSVTRASSGADIGAGLLTALVFYAEYVSLGSQLGGRLGGAGQAGAALGMLLVFGSVLFCCACALLRRHPLLSGPRAASLGLTCEALGHVGPQLLDRTQTAPTFFLALLVLGICAVAVQALGLLPQVRRLIMALEPAVVKGFMFATAVGILAGMAQERLAGCLGHAFWTSLTIFSGGMALALGWGKLCEGVKALRRYKAMALVVGAGAAWAGVALLLPQASSATGCGAIGGQGMGWSLLTERLPPWHAPWSVFANLPAVTWLILAAYGAMVGLIQLVESLTTLRDVEPMRSSPAIWRPYILTVMLANSSAALCGLSPASYSTSRSNVLLQAGASSRLAVLMHGIAVAVMMTVAAPLVAQVPLLAVGVALAMVAVQMIDGEMAEGVWKPAYGAAAGTAQVHAAWRFWAVVLVAAATGSITGLLVGSLLYGMSLLRLRSDEHARRKMSHS